MSIPFKSLLGDEIVLGGKPSAKGLQALKDPPWSVRVCVDIRTKIHESDHTPDHVQDAEMTYIRVPCAVEIRGEKEKDQQHSLITSYIKVARDVQKELPKSETRIYIFDRAGTETEVYVGMALWFIRSFEGKKSSSAYPKKESLAKWIDDHHFGAWFDDNDDKRDLLGELVAEIKPKGLCQYFAKRARPNE